MQIAQTLDDIGRPAWIALMVVGFILFWPIGLAILGFMMWSGRMGCGSSGRWSRWHEGRERFFARGGFCSSARRTPSSGNTAFDDYRADTLRRLEEEQQEFTSFLDRLRRAKDKAEFDQFMAERRQLPQQQTAPDTPASGNPAS
jgi:hypothetical protein